MYITSNICVWYKFRAICRKFYVFINYYIGTLQSFCKMSGLTVEERKALAKKYLETSVVDVQKARDRIRPYVHKTALYRSLWLSDESTESNVYLKMGKV
jgi:hypothetical protein